MLDIAALLAAALERAHDNLLVAPADVEDRHTEGEALGHRIAVAVSGGPDSLALLYLAASAFPTLTTALTVDHGLRYASATEAATVASLCNTLDIPHFTLQWQGTKPRTNIQATARTARYALMGDWCAAAGIGLLLTAHHADDQAETLLMQLQRGSGTAGLAGIRAARALIPGVTLVRPLLSVRRAALAAIVASAGWTPANDPSNADPHYARTRARALLAATPTFDVPRIATVAAHLAQAETALDWAAQRAWAGCATVAPSQIRLDIAGLPSELVRRLLVRAIAEIAPAARPGGAAITIMLAKLAAGGSATLAGVKVRGGEIWHFSPASLRRNTS